MLLAEVMDKEPTLTFLWSFFLGIGTVGLLIGMIRWWMCLAVAPFVALFAAVHLGELYDPNVGPDILAEAGREYVVQSHLAIFSGVLLPIPGIVPGWISRNRQTAKTITSGRCCLSVRE